MYVYRCSKTVLSTSIVFLSILHRQRKKNEKSINRDAHAVLAEQPVEKTMSWVVQGKCMCQVNAEEDDDDCWSTIFSFKHESSWRVIFTDGTEKCLRVLKIQSTPSAHAVAEVVSIYPSLFLIPSVWWFNILMELVQDVESFFASRCCAAVDACWTSSWAPFEDRFFHGLTRFFNLLFTLSNFSSISEILPILFKVRNRWFFAFMLSRMACAISSWGICHSSSSISCRSSLPSINSNCVRLGGRYSSNSSTLTTTGSGSYSHSILCQNGGMDSRYVSKGVLAHSQRYSTQNDLRKWRSTGTGRIVSYSSFVFSNFDSIPADLLLICCFLSSWRVQTFFLRQNFHTALVWLSLCGCCSHLVILLYGVTKSDIESLRSIHGVWIRTHRSQRNGTAQVPVLFLKHALSRRNLGHFWLLSC